MTRTYEKKGTEMQLTKCPNCLTGNMVPCPETGDAWCDKCEVSLDGPESEVKALTSGKTTELRDEIIRILDVHLSDWEPDHLMWNHQAGRLADHLIENMNEIAPRRYFPDTAKVFYLDGDQWCCCRGSFVDLQTSLAGFGRTMEDAFSDLDRQEQAAYEAIEQESSNG